MPGRSTCARTRDLGSLDRRGGLAMAGGTTKSEIEAKPASRPFWESGKYGSYHMADRTSRRYVDGLLVVFVHGIASGPGMWEERAVRLMFSNTGLEADVLAYSYPSWPCQVGSIDQAAKHLRTAIHTTMGDRRERLSPVPVPVL